MMMKKMRKMDEGGRNWRNIICTVIVMMMKFLFDTSVTVASSSNSKQKLTPDVDDLAVGGIHRERIRRRNAAGAAVCSRHRHGVGDSYRYHALQARGVFPGVNDVVDCDSSIESFCLKLKKKKT